MSVALNWKEVVYWVSVGIAMFSAGFLLTIAFPTFAKWLALVLVGIVVTICGLLVLTGLGVLALGKWRNREE